jgi:transposase
MANVLSEQKRQQVIALWRLKWPLRRIERETGVRRETASAYLKAAGVEVRRQRGRILATKPASQTSTDPKPASRVSTDPVELGGWPPVPVASPRASACEPYRDFIEASVAKGRNATAIYQDLVTYQGFSARYASVKRFVRKLDAGQPEPRAVIQTAPGEEAQVDYGEGPMVLDPQSGRYRRTRLFVLTLGFSRKCVRLLTFRSSSRIWADLHEQAFARLGAGPMVIVLDNLREGVLKPDVYDPALNPLFRDLLAHYGATALPCRVRDPDRKGKVERGVDHAQRTPLRGLRFVTLAEAQEYLDRWERTWADTRIHGTTKRQVAAMFADELPHLLPLPTESFRFYQCGERSVHLDGHVEVERAYYSVPPGYIGHRVQVQWDDKHVRIIDRHSGELLREHRRNQPGRFRTEAADLPRRVLPTTRDLLERKESCFDNF